MNNYIELYDYMYNGIQTIKKINEKKIIKQRNELEFNNIFWIFYYLLNGNQEYILNNKNFKVKNDILYKFVERINNNEFKSIFMENKIYKKNKIIEILSNNNDIDLMCFSFICDIENIIFLVENNQFFYTNYPNYDDSIDLINDDITKNVEKYVLINEIEKKINFVNEDEFKKQILKKRNDLVYVKNPQKIIYAVSNYKTNELYDLANKLNVDYNIKVKKCGNYKNIIDKIVPSLFFQLN
jgi:hypothetical protein